MKKAIYLIALLSLSACQFEQSFPESIIVNHETRILEDQLKLSVSTQQAMKEQVEVLKSTWEKLKERKPKITALDESINAIKARFDKLYIAHGILKDEMQLNGVTVSKNQKIKLPEDKRMLSEVEKGPEDLVKYIMEKSEDFAEKGFPLKVDNKVSMYVIHWRQFVEKTTVLEAQLIIESGMMGLYALEMKFYQALLETAEGQVLVYDKFDVLNQPKSPTVRLGEEFVTEIALGAYSSQAESRTEVNGRAVPNSNNKAIFKEKAVKEGLNPYQVKIYVTNPQTGKVETVSKEFSYFVVK